MSQRFWKLGKKMVMYNQTKVILLKMLTVKFIGLSTVDDTYTGHMNWVTSPCMNGFRFIQDWSVLNQSQKRFQSQKHDVSHQLSFSLMRRWYRFWKWFSYVESDQASEKRKLPGKYPFCKNHPLMKLIKSVFLNPKIGAQFCRGITAWCDKGDREVITVYNVKHCFNHGRHGKNLKDEDQSWDEAFTDY